MPIKKAYKETTSRNSSTSISNHNPETRMIDIARNKKKIQI